MIQVICADISNLREDNYRVLCEKASPERRNRAARYRNTEDAARCITADALLRHALGTDTYTIARMPGGKPCIPERPEFHCNLSHSGNWVAIAFGGTPVGVDVEKIRQDSDVEAVARRYFTPQEQRFLAENTRDARQRFFEIWTKKESYLKFLGAGLTKDLRSFNVLDPQPGIRYFGQTLPGEYCLSLCTTEESCRFTILNANELK